MTSLKRVAGFVLLSSVIVPYVRADRPAPAFTSGPTVVRAGATARIEFAVDRETDVAVFIEDSQGKTVRHLAAGVLGKNAPLPLKPGLVQSLEWDGKANYGKPAGAGPFRVRVALGLDVRFDRVLIEDRNAFNRIKGLTVGRDGTVYVLDTSGGAVWSGEQIMAFGRDGEYLRTVAPFPVRLPMDKVEALGAMELRGGLAPVVQSHRLRFLPGPTSPRKTAMAVTPDGQALLRLTGGMRGATHQRIGVLGTDGSAVWPDPVGQELLSQTVPPSKDGGYRGAWGRQPALAVSPGGQWAYVSGFAFGKTPYAAVFRVPLPARGPAEIFFGSIEEAGKDNRRLGGPAQGLAFDGQGHLLISDTENGRVVAVRESDASYVGEFGVERPGPLGADPKTGAVYVACGKGGGSRGIVELVKFSGWKEAREQARALVRPGGNGTFAMALDVLAPRPLIWIGTDGGDLLRIEDADDKLDVRVASSKEGTNGSFLDMSVDRFRPDREIYCRNNLGWWYRYNEETDLVEKVNLAGNAGLRAGGGAGKQILAGPDGNLYGLAYPYHMFKLDRDANPLGLPESDYPEEAMGRKMDKIRGLNFRGKQFGRFVPVSMTDMSHTLGIRGDGHVFALEPPRHSNRPPKALHEYSPSGRRITTDPIVWMVSPGAVGPRFDAAGNIYIAEIVNPGERPYPEEFERLFGKIEMEKTRPSGVQDEIANMYGSIVKFSPRGGTIHFPPERIGARPYEGEPKLDASLKTMDVAYYAKRAQQPVRITGAEWLAFGYSHVEVNACTCETTRFDVDEFGRVFFPDLCLYQVRVVDTAGNPLLNFGGYGNADSRGPESADSALANPEIAFAWLVGVVATDKYVYTGDSVNRRMLRLKQVYAAERTLDIE